MSDGTGKPNRAYGAVLGGAIATWMLGCGGAPPPANTPAPPAAAQPAVIAADVSDAADPSHVVAVVRWRNPSATLDTVYRWTGLRLSPADLLAQMWDPGLVNSLAFEAPVDCVVALDPKATDEPPAFAVAVGVRSIEAARRAAQTMGPVTEVRPGEYRVSLRANSKKKGDRASCLLAPARGATSARFVCGRRDRDVDALRGFLTRTLPERDLGPSDLHFELHAPPVLEVYGPMIQQGLHIGAAVVPRRLEIGEPMFDRAVGRAAQGVSEELGAVLGDLDKLTLDVALAPDKADASFALHFKNQQSWTAGTLASQASRAGSAPPMFWALPAGATTAGYTYSPDARRFDGIRRTLAELLDGWLLHEGVPPAERTPLKALFDDKYVTDSPWVSASGPFTREPPAKASAKANPPASPDPLQSAVEGFGWYVAAIGTPNHLPEFFKNLALAVNRPKLQTFVRSKLASLASPSETSEAAALSSSEFTLKSAPPPKELPKGSLSFELTITQEGAPTRARAEAGKAAPKKQPKAPVKFYVFIVPESARTWIALGGDKGQLAKTVLASTEGAAETGKLAARQDLGFFKSGKFTSATFLTLESILQSWLGGAARAQFDSDMAKSVGEARSLLESSPNKGKTPMIFTSDIATGSGLTWTTRLDVPKGVIEDAIILAASSRLLTPRP